MSRFGVSRCPQRLGCDPIQLDCPSLHAKRGGSGDSGVFSVACRDEWNFEAAGIDAPCRQPSSDFFEQWCQHNCNATAHNDDVGL